MASRAEKRRAERAAQKAFGGKQSEIRLQNPVAGHFSSFIFGNATMQDGVIEQGQNKGQHVVICGAGPSLADTAADYVDKADEVWGCNSALIYLRDRGLRVTHGLTVDQTPHMLEEWATTPDVMYYLASSVHPHLTDLLRINERPYRIFHNYVGLRENPVEYGVCVDCETVVQNANDPCSKCKGENVDRQMMAYEDWIYSALYPATVRAGSGLNTTSRAMDVALFAGFEKITVLGADCALRLHQPRPDCAEGSPEHMDWLRNHAQMHADGSTALRSGATAVTLGGEIDGRWWESKPDMLITAVWMADMANAYPERIELVGDTLPNAIRDKPEDFLARLPQLTDHKGRAVRYHRNPNV
jgi:hypothetical protein